MTPTDSEFLSVFLKRLNCSASLLEKMAAKAYEAGATDRARALTGKAQGIRLAISYAEEEVRTNR